MILVKQDAFDQSFLINCDGPSVKFPKYKMSHDLAAQRSEDQRPSFKQVLLPRPEDNRPIFQHHNALSVFLMVPNEAVVKEFVSFEHLQGRSHIFLGAL